MATMALAGNLEATPGERDDRFENVAYADEFVLLGAGEPPGPPLPPDGEKPKTCEDVAKNGCAFETSSGKYEFTCYVGKEEETCCSITIARQEVCDECDGKKKTTMVASSGLVETYVYRHRGSCGGGEGGSPPLQWRELEGRSWSTSLTVQGGEDEFDDLPEDVKSLLMIFAPGIQAVDAECLGGGNGVIQEPAEPDWDEWGLLSWSTSFTVPVGESEFGHLSEDVASPVKIFASGIQAVDVECLGDGNGLIQEPAEPDHEQP